MKYLIYREGIIQPSTIGPDGRPQAVEHILELTANMDITEEHDSDWNPCTASPVYDWILRNTKVTEIGVQKNFCEPGYFHSGENFTKILQDLLRGRNFPGYSPISSIKSYGFYFYGKNNFVTSAKITPRRNFQLYSSSM